jgi:hypothetical protein
MRKVKDIETSGRAAPIGGFMLLATLLTGCSSDGTTAQSGSSRSLSEIFSSKPASYAQAGATGAAASTEFDPSDCPPVDVRQGASTFSANTAGKNPAETVLRYQGSFAQTARSCSRSGTTMTIRLGVQGRIILGPGGGPGQIDVPLRFALVQEGVQPKTVWTRFYNVPVTIGDGQPSTSFTHIEDDLTVPMPNKDVLEAYVLYVGFDPMGLSQKPKPAPPPRNAKPKVNG